MSTADDVIGIRIVASIIDIILVGTLRGIAALLISGLFESFGMTLVISALFPFLYFIVLEGEYGQTAGKRLLGIAVVHDDGSPCSMLSSTIRNIFRVIDQLPAFYLLGIVLILFTDSGQRVGDIAGGTVVVRTE